MLFHVLFGMHICTYVLYLPDIGIPTHAFQGAPTTYAEAVRPDAGGWASLPGCSPAIAAIGIAIGDASSVAKLQSATRSALLSLTSWCGAVRIRIYVALSASLAHKHVRSQLGDVRFVS